MKLSVVYQPAVSASTSAYRLRDNQGTEVGECLPGRSVPPPTFPPFASHLRLRPSRFRPLVRTATSAACRDHGVHPRGIRPSSTRSRSQTHSPDRESSPGHRALLLSLSHWPRNSCWQSTFPAPLCQTIPAGLRPSSPRRRPGISPQTRSAGHRAAHGEEVAKFWRSFRTFRDLALVGLMLLDGLRSREVLALQLQDVQLADGQMRVRGKGNKQRLLPFPPDILEVLGHYLHLERPLTNTPALFLCLKGRSRGQPMTAAGLRSLFRHHRVRSRIPRANPHRFRHTFGTDMVRAGISLPALQQLMGHSHIHTTMLYVELAPQDVWREYACAIEKRRALDSSHLS